MKSVKTFIKEHKCEIEAVASVIAVVAASGTIGYLCGRCADKGEYTFATLNITKMLNDAKRIYPNKFAEFVGINDPGVRASDLGELGAEMIKHGCADDSMFTHFIAIGPSHIE